METPYSTEFADSTRIRRMNKFRQPSRHSRPAYCEVDWGTSPVSARCRPLPLQTGRRKHRRADLQGVRAANAARPRADRGSSRPLSAASYPNPLTLKPIAAHNNASKSPTRLTPNPIRSHIQSQRHSQLATQALVTKRKTQPSISQCPKCSYAKRQERNSRTHVN
jgi:hypothetical protein